MALLFALAMLAVLFAVAGRVEARARGGKLDPRFRHIAYALAIGVYCSSWTFYGAAGSAAREGWSYLPIYLAPILLLLVGGRFLGNLAQAVTEEQATTVSDFIAARFGHDIVVARLVTVIALLASIPYAALQFRSIGNALALASGQDIAVVAMVVAAGLLAVFAILFGARQFEIAGRSEGLLYAIGLESLIKILALLLVSAFAIAMLIEAPPALVTHGADLLLERFQPGKLSLDFAVIFLVSALAIVALPRQFYMGLVEAHRPGDLPRARHGVAIYLAIMASVVLPIALAGAALLPATAPPDLFVLQLPILGSHPWVAACALLGGISAASAMVIVDSIALAAMVSNDLFFPTIVRSGADSEAGLLGRRMLLVRRLSIIGIMALALAWSLLLSSKQSLASIGLVAFTGVAQFSPHLLLATWQRNLDPAPARASLLVGLLVWIYTLALPQVLPDATLEWLRNTSLDPLRLFGVGQASPLAHGILWSLGLNLLTYAAMAARRATGGPLPQFLRSTRTVRNIQDLAELTASFIGEDAAAEVFPIDQRNRPVDRRSAQRAQELIAGIVGASSAHALVRSALAGGQMSLQDATQLLDAGGQSLHFSRQLLVATFENIDAGISVVDIDLNLVAWNSRYLDFFDYPPGMVRAGMPIADLIRHNARRGDFGPGDVEFHVQKRLDHLRRGLVHSFERHRKDGRVIKTVGGPMPGGGYVMSFTDTTEEARMREELRHTLEGLERRVAERTSELSEANRQLAEATRDKTRFLAAASHDLLQPLHAARLFTAALEREATPTALGLVHQVEKSIVAAEDLLRALLDISRLDAGGVEAHPQPLALQDFLRDLASGIAPFARTKGLQLRVGPLPGTVETDPGLLRSVIQNFLVNAVRYTERGGVLMGVRRRADRWRIDIVDTGVGIPPEKLDDIFREFVRLGDVEAEGLGLGLALSERIVRLLGGRIEVRSVPGRGSRFSVYLPASSAQHERAPVPAASPDRLSRALSVLVIDNDPRIVEASEALLTRMGHRVLGATDRAGALALCGEADAILADYQLDNGDDGLGVVAAVRARRPGLPAALVTAENDPAIRTRAAAAQMPVFEKPVSAAAIEGFLADASVA